MEYKRPGSNYSEDLSTPLKIAPPNKKNKSQASQIGTLEEDTASTSISGLSAKNQESSIRTFNSIIDNAIKCDRFKIDDCIDFEKYLAPIQKNECDIIKKKLSSKEYIAFKKSIIRNSFLIELVNDDVTSTKVETHWSTRLSGDVRYSSFDNCVAIFNMLLKKIASLSEENFSVLKIFFSNTVIPYEIPVDYINRSASPIHTAQNIDLFLTDEIKKCITIRSFLRDSSKNPEHQVFKKILEDKIKVKTYLTDRAQTGDYKTNREKRWEAHPNSVQYALRRDCMKIETKLLLQIATFEGCNPTLVTNLQSEALLSASFSYCKCPITGDNIQYTDFKNDALNPTHGKSKFQVGHLNPLKASATGGANGHTADNISWISEDGNRIQGSLSIDEVNTLLRRIFINRPELHT